MDYCGETAAVLINRRTEVLLMPKRLAIADLLSPTA
jgi:hypothetical protein